MGGNNCRVGVCRVARYGEGIRLMTLLPRVTGGRVSCPAPPPCTSPASPPSSSSRLGCCLAGARHRLTCASGRNWSSCCTSSPKSPTSPPHSRSDSIPTPSASGGSAGPRDSSTSKTDPAGAGGPPSPPLDRAQVTALACEEVARTQSPISRQSHGDLARLSSALLGEPISRRTVGRILDEDSIKPWRYEHWIFPRAEDFYDRASVVLDLYEG